jgi:hypothetical protein
MPNTVQEISITIPKALKQKLTISERRLRERDRERGTFYANMCLLCPVLKDKPVCQEQLHPFALADFQLQVPNF